MASNIKNISASEDLNAALADLDGIVTVLFAQGTYKMTANFAVPSGVTLVIDENAIIDGRDYELTLTSGRVVVDGDVSSFGLSNLTLSGGAADGALLSVAPGAGSLEFTASGVTVKPAPSVSAFSFSRALTGDRAFEVVPAGAGAEVPNTGAAIDLGSGMETTVLPTVYQEMQGKIVLSQGLLSLRSDLSFQSATITIDGARDGDVLSFSDDANALAALLRVTLSFDSETGILAIEPAEGRLLNAGLVELLLEAVEFENTTTLPGSSRTFDYELIDKDGNTLSATAVLQINDLNEAPDLALNEINSSGWTTGAATAVFEQGDSAIDITADAAVSLDDVEDDAINLVTVKIVNPADTSLESLALRSIAKDDDLFGLTPAALAAVVGVTVSYNASTATLSFAASTDLLADGQATTDIFEYMINEVEYTNTAANPIAGTGDRFRTIEVVAEDTLTANPASSDPLLFKIDLNGDDLNAINTATTADEMKVAVEDEGVVSNGITDLVDADSGVYKSLPTSVLTTLHQALIDNRPGVGYTSFAEFQNNYLAPLLQVYDAGLDFANGAEAASPTELIDALNQAINNIGTLSIGSVNKAVLEAAKANYAGLDSGRQQALATDLDGYRNWSSTDLAGDLLPMASAMLDYQIAEKAAVDAANGSGLTVALLQAISDKLDAVKAVADATTSAVQIGGNNVATLMSKVDGQITALSSLTSDRLDALFADIAAETYVSYAELSSRIDAVEPPRTAVDTAVKALIVAANAGSPTVAVSDFESVQTALAGIETANLTTAINNVPVEDISASDLAAAITMFKGLSAGTQSAVLVRVDGAQTYGSLGDVLAAVEPALKAELFAQIDVAADADAVITVLGDAKAVYADAFTNYDTLESDSKTFVAAILQASKNDLADFDAVETAFGKAVTLADAVEDFVAAANTGVVADITTALTQAQGALTGLTIPGLDATKLSDTATGFAALEAGRQLAAVNDLKANGGEGWALADVYTGNMLAFAATSVVFRTDVQEAVASGNAGTLTSSQIGDIKTSLEAVKAVKDGATINGTDIGTIITAIDQLVTDLDALASGRFDALVADLASNGPHASFTAMSTVLEPLLQFREAVQTAVDKANAGTLVLADLRAVETELGDLGTLKVNGVAADTLVSDAKAGNDRLDALADGRFEALVADAKESGPHASFTDLSGKLNLVEEAYTAVEAVVDAANADGSDLTVALITEAATKMAAAEGEPGLALSGETVTGVELSAALSTFAGLRDGTEASVLVKVAEGNAYSSLDSVLAAFPAALEAVGLQLVNDAANAADMLAAFGDIDVYADDVALTAVLNSPDKSAIAADLILNRPGAGFSSLDAASTVLNALEDAYSGLADNFDASLFTLGNKGADFFELKVGATTVRIGEIGSIEFADKTAHVVGNGPVEGIRAAINASDDGDVILVSPGNHDITEGGGTPTFAGHNLTGLTFLGAGEDATTISGNARVASLSRDGGRPIDMTIEGMTLSYVDESGYIMQWGDANNVTGLTLRDVTFTGTHVGNTIGDYAPYADVRGADNLLLDGVTVELTGSATGPQTTHFLFGEGDGITIKNSSFAGTFTNAVNLFGSTNVLIDGNTFGDGNGFRQEGVAVTLSQSSGTVTNNTFKDGAYLDLRQVESNTITATGNTFTLGENEFGILVRTEGAGDPAASQFTIESNTFTMGEGAVPVLNDLATAYEFGINTVDGKSVVLKVGTNATDTIAALDDKIELIVAQTGADIVTFSGNFADYAVGVDGSGTITVTKDSQVDTLVGVEALKFADGFGVVEGLSIQTAIDLAAAGDTVNVAAGTYEESLSIDKAVNILGPNAGKAGFAADRVLEAIIGGKVTVSGENASLVGLTLSKPSSSTSSNNINYSGWDGINLVVSGDGANVSNTIVEAFGAAGGFAGSGFVTLGASSTFTGNLVSAGVGYAAADDERGVSSVHVNAGTDDAVTISNNHLLVSTNVNIAGDADALFVNNAGEVLIEGNLLKGTDGGFVAFGNYGKLTILDNTIEAYAKTALRVFESTSVEKPDVILSGNSIDASGDTIIMVDGSVKLGVSGEPFPAIASNFTGIPAIYRANDLAGDYGVVAGGKLRLFADQSEAISEALSEPQHEAIIWNFTEARFEVYDGMSIQAAIDAAEAGDIVVVSAGTYDEAVTVGTSDLTILGPNMGVAGTAGTRVDEAIVTGKFSVTSGGSGLTVDGMKLAPSSTATNQVFIRGDGTTLTNSVVTAQIEVGIDNFTLSNSFIGGMGSRDGTSGVAQNALYSDQASGGSNWIITGNTFNDFARGLTLASASGVTYENLQVLNNIFQNFTHRAIQFGDNATIDGATITGNSFVNGQAGIGIFNPVDVTSAVVDIDENSFNDLTIGVWINSPSAAGVTVDQVNNTFTNVDQTVRYQSPISSLDTEVAFGSSVNSVDADLAFFAATDSSSARYTVTVGDETVSLVGVGTLSFADKTVHVVGQGGFETIQAAIDAAGAGDTIVVADGSYGPVTIDKSITLSALSDGAKIVGEGVNQGAAVRIGDAVEDVVISGFDIQAGDGDLAAVNVVGGNKGVTLSSNIIDGADGHSVLAGGGVDGVLLKDNTMSADGPTAVVYVNGLTSVGSASTNVSLTGNTITGGENAGLLVGLESTGGKLQDNIFSGKASYAALELWGAGVVIGGSGDSEANSFSSFDTVLIDQNRIYRVSELVAGNTFSDPRIELVDNEGGGNIYNALNRALAAAATTDTARVPAGTFDLAAGSYIASIFLTGDVTLNIDGTTDLTGSVTATEGKLTLAGSGDVTLHDLDGTLLAASGLTGALTILDASGTVQASAGTLSVTATAALSVDADAATFVSLAGSGAVTVTNLTANVDASALAGVLSVTADDAAAFNVNTGSADTTISSNSVGESSQIGVDASALASAAKLTLNGSSKFNVGNLGGNLDASGISGELRVGRSAEAEAATIVGGSGENRIELVAGDTVSGGGVDDRFRVFDNADLVGTAIDAGVGLDRIQLVEADAVYDFASAGAITGVDRIDIAANGIEVKLTTALATDADTQDTIHVTAYDWFESTDGKLAYQLTGTATVDAAALSQGQKLEFTGAEVLGGATVKLGVADADLVFGVGVDTIQVSAAPSDVNAVFNSDGSVTLTDTVTNAVYTTDGLEKIVLSYEVDSIPASQTVLLVGGNSAFATIQEAVNAASDGDAIEIAPGTYTEVVTIPDGKSLSIGGQGSSTVIDGAFVVNGDGSSIQDLTVTGGGKTAGSDSGVYIAAANVTLEDLTLTGPNQGDTGGTYRGILTAAGEGLNLSVSNVTASGWATGIYLNPGATNASISGSDFSGNYVGMSIDGNDGVTLTGNTFDGTLEDLGLGAAGIASAIGNTFGSGQFGNYAGETVTLGQNTVGSVSFDVIRLGQTTADNTITLANGTGTTLVVGGGGTDTVVAPDEDAFGLHIDRVSKSGSDVILSFEGGEVATSVTVTLHGVERLVSTPNDAVASFFGSLDSNGALTLSLEAADGFPVKLTGTATRPDLYFDATDVPAVAELAAYFFEGEAVEIELMADVQYPGEIDLSVVLNGGAFNAASVTFAKPTDGVVEIGPMYAPDPSKVLLSGNVSFANAAPVLADTDVSSVQGEQAVEGDVLDEVAVSDLLALFKDTDLGSSLGGIAVSGVQSAGVGILRGVWQFREPGRTDFQDLAAVVGAGLSPAEAVLLSGETQLRFLAAASSEDEPNFGSVPTLSFVAVDDTQPAQFNSTGKFTTPQFVRTADVSVRGTDTPYSSTVATYSQEVVAANDPGGFDSVTFAATTITEDFFTASDGGVEEPTSTSYDTVASIFDEAFSDADGGALTGVVVVASEADASKGHWEYSADLGVSWSVVGTVSDSQGLFLASDAELRFVPNWNFTGDAPALTVRSVDDTGLFTSGSIVEASSVGRGTPFGNDTATLGVSVTPEEDAYEFADTGTFAHSGDPGSIAVYNGEPVVSLLNFDRDSGVGLRDVFEFDVADTLSLVFDNSMDTVIPANANLLVYNAAVSTVDATTVGNTFINAAIASSFNSLFPAGFFGGATGTLGEGVGIFRDQAGVTSVWYTNEINAAKQDSDNNLVSQQTLLGYIGGADWSLSYQEDADANATPTTTTEELAAFLASDFAFV